MHAVRLAALGDGAAGGELGAGLGVATGRLLAVSEGLVSGDGRDDEALLRAHAEGDPDAFAVLFRRHRDRLWAVALRTTGDREDAADALQDALLSAHRAAPRFRGDSAVTTWLHRIVVNACLDRHPPAAGPPDRAAARRQARAATPTARAAWSRRRRSPTTTPPWSSAQALAKLPDEQRAALVLVDLQGYPVAEVALILGVAEGTIKSRCARGRARLAMLLGHLRRPNSRRAPRHRGEPPDGRPRHIYATIHRRRDRGGVMNAQPVDHDLLARLRRRRARRQPRRRRCRRAGRQRPGVGRRRMIGSSSRWRRSAPISPTYAAVDEPMPDDVAARLDAALADAPADGGAPRRAARPARGGRTVGRSTGPARAGTGAGGGRFPAWLAPVAVAAGVVAFAGFWLTSAGGGFSADDSGGTAATSSDAGANAEQAPAAARADPRRRPPAATTTTGSGRRRSGHVDSTAPQASAAAAHRQGGSGHVQRRRRRGGPGRTSPA